jgi:hypothetical protein
VGNYTKISDFTAIHVTVIPRFSVIGGIQAAG